MRKRCGWMHGWLIAAVLPLEGIVICGNSHAQTDDTYREVRVVRGDIDVDVLSSGVVEPQNRLEIKPPISGRVEQVLVDVGDEIKRGQILAWISSTERAALLDAAHARGGDEVKRWESFYKATPVMAPIDGMLIVRNVEPGQTFSNQDAVFVMSDHLVVKAQVDETDIAQIKLKQTAVITLDAYPDKTIPGVVTEIAYEATTVNNVTTYVVDVLPDHPSAFMRSGMTANVNFAVDAKAAVLLLPSEAIKAGKSGPYVLTPANAQNQKGKMFPEETSVRIGLSDGKSVEIVSGLEEGAKVLIAETKAADEGPVNPFMPFGRKRK